MDKGTKSIPTSTLVWASTRCRIWGHNSIQHGLAHGRRLREVKWILEAFAFVVRIAESPSQQISGLDGSDSQIQPERKPIERIDFAPTETRVESAKFNAP